MNVYHVTYCEEIGIWAAIVVAPTREEAKQLCSPYK